MTTTNTKTTKRYEVTDTKLNESDWFIDRTQAIEYAMELFKRHMEYSHMSRAEAAAIITIETTTVTVENLADFIGVGMGYMEELDENNADDEQKAEPSRDDLSGTMREELDRLESEHKRAQDAEDFEEWYTGGKVTLDEIRNRYEGKRGEMRERMIDDARARYERALCGILDTSARQTTIDALERRGFVKYEGLRRVKLLTI